MSYAKKIWMEEMERGWSSTNIIICDKCMCEDYLAAHIRKMGKSGCCNYCKRKRQTLPLDDIMESILSAAYFEYDHPENGLGWDGREGGWQAAQVWDSYDLIYDVFELGGSPAFDDIVRVMTDQQWCKKEFYSLSDQEQMTFSWQSFVRMVKHSKRFLFTSDKRDENDTEILTPKETLRMIGDAVKNLDFICQIPIGTVFFRARATKESEKFNTPEELGAPHEKKSIYPSRMSSAGIPMFYGAYDKETCITEVKKDGNKKFTTAKWKTIKVLNLVDLTDFKRHNDSEQWYFSSGVPSIFDELEREKLPYYRFFSDFMKDFTAPVTKDGREHIDYVPTQVVAEYLRWQFKTDSGYPVNGILYPSTKNGNVCCVLFCGQEGCVSNSMFVDRQILEMDEGSIEVN